MLYAGYLRIRDFPGEIHNLGPGVALNRLLRKTLSNNSA